MADAPNDVIRRPVRSYVLRQGRLSPAQARALADLAPRYAIPFAHAPLDFGKAFGRHADVVLEIGCGMGETTAAIAAAHPGIDFLGIEVHAPGVGAILNRIAQSGLDNVRMIQHDAVEVVDAMIPEGSLGGIHVYFPDPWHKKRHHKRRLIQPPFVELVASRLAPGGVLKLATDWEEYALQMLDVMRGNPQFTNLSPGGDWMPRPEERAPTRFEKRGARLGHGVWDLAFRRG